MHFCDFELTNEFGEAFLEFVVCKNVGDLLSKKVLLVSSFRMEQLTHYWLEGVLTIQVQVGLRRKLHRIDNVDAHIDQRLHDCVVFGPLCTPCQSSAISTRDIPEKVHSAIPVHHPKLEISETHHEALGVGVDPTTLQPRPPDGWLGKPNPKVAPVLLDSEAAALRRRADFASRWQHQRIRQRD